MTFDHETHHSTESDVLKPPRPQAPTTSDGRGPENPELAQGSLSAAHIVFMVMATVAPAGGAVAILPLALGLGVGLGTPGMYLFMVVIMLLFAAGYTRMVPHVHNAGAFFAYIVRGLGRLPGLAGAYVATLAYLALAGATSGAMGFFAAGSVDKFFGVDLPWWIYTVIGLAIAFVLGYLRITLAAGVLGVALVCELVIVLVLDVAVLVRNGMGSLPAASFSPGEVFGAGAVGVGMIFAFSCYQGFEGTAIYAEEAREPERTIPRATYVAICCIGLFFILTSWAFISGAGGDQAAATALKDPGSFAYNLSDEFVGTAWTSVLEVLIVTSTFAGVLAFHNAASRYMFALARDGFLPSPLSRLHPRYASPKASGITSFVIVTVVVLVFAAAGLDPLTNLSASLTGFGAVGLMALITTTSAGVVVFFWRRGERTWSRIIAPAVATVGFGAVTYFALTNFEAITGTDSKVINSMPYVHLVVIIVAVLVAWRARRHRPSAYRNMGRTLVD